MKLRSVFIALALVGFGSSSACDQDPEPSDEFDAGDSAVAQTEAGPELPPADVEVPTIPDATPPDAAPTTTDAAAPPPLVPVRVGLSNGPNEGVLADLEVITLGARSTTVDYLWAADDGAALDAALDRAELFSSESVNVLFSIDVVSGARRLVPALSPTPTDDLYQVIDRIFERGINLFAISIGEGLDVSLVNLASAERAGLVELVDGFIDYATLHPLRPETTLVSFSTTANAWGDSSLELSRWLAAAQAVSISWFAIDSRGRASSSTEPGEYLSPRLTPITSAGKPVFFREVAYPSASAADSTEEKQERFFKNLFEDLVGRGDQIPFLTATLDEPTESDCATYLMDYPMSADATPQVSEGAILARCSVGLRAAGVPKRAFYQVVDAIASSGSP